MSGWNDDTLDLKRGPVRGALDMGALQPAVQGMRENVDRAQVEGGARLTQDASAAAVAAQPKPNKSFKPAEFAVNKETGEIALPNGKIVKMDAPTILQLATLKNDAGHALPKMKQEVMDTLQESGFRPYSHGDLVAGVEKVPTESDFWGQAVSSGKQGLGLMASMVDSFIGNDDPNNGWTHAQADHEKDETLGQLKGSRARWYSSWDSFASNLGQSLGNVGSTVVGAIPFTAAGAAVGAIGGDGVGAIPGAIGTAGTILTGGAAGYGEQATDFYTSAMKAMDGMDPVTLQKESPLFQQVMSENPSRSFEDAKREVAIRGARTAGTVGGILSSVETMVGIRLAKNFIGRMGFLKAAEKKIVDAAVGDRVEKTLGRKLGGLALRAGGYGAGESLQEMAESAFGQAAGAERTGIGSNNPLDHVDVNEGIAAFPMGSIFGALGGHGHANKQAEGNIQTSDLADALHQTPSLNTDWSQAQQPTERQDLVPAYMRRQPGQGLQGDPSAGPAGPGVQAPGVNPSPNNNADAMRQQLEAVITQRFGENWDPGVVAKSPQGAQLLGQLMALEQQAQQESQPAYQRGYGPTNQGSPGYQPVPAGQPSLQGPAFGDVPGQQPNLPGMPPGGPMQQGLAEDAPAQSAPADQAQGDLLNQPSPPPQPNLNERRTWQQMQQEQRAAASEQNPALLPARPSRTIEQQIFDAEDQIHALEQAVKERPPRDPRKKHLQSALDEANARLADLESQWQQAREQEGPDPQSGQQSAPPATVDSPEPVAATDERTPDGRPLGVTPAALENPEPMHPGEAASRAKTQAERRGEATATSSSADVMQDEMAQTSDEGVHPSTPEPQEDVAAQVDAMMDPSSGRDAVFVAEGAKAPVVKGAIRVVRKGVGTLLTTNQKKAQDFRTKKLTDAVMAKMLGYSESKANVLKSGAPVAVQAVTKTGAVAAEQIATRKGVPAAKAAVAKLGPKGAKVVEVSTQKAQERRSARERAVAAVKKTAKPATDDERTTAKDLNDTTRTERVLAKPREERQATAAAAAPADTIGERAARAKDSVTFKGKQVQLPTRLTQLTGEKGTHVDLRAHTVDEEGRWVIGQMIDSGVLNAADQTKAEAAARDFDQMGTMLDGAVAAAEDRLRSLYEAAEDGGEAVREAEKRQLEVEQLAQQGERGRPRGKPRTSPIFYLPLLVSESQGYLEALRRQAKAELAEGYSAAHSLVRRMASAVHPGWVTAFQNDQSAKKMLARLATVSDEELETLLRGTHDLIKDSTVAKQVMRGATEVAHALRRAENDVVGSRIHETLDLNHAIEGLPSKKYPHATEHGVVPKTASGLVQAWVQQFEKGGNKFSAPVHVISMKEALRLFPGSFLGRGRVPNGKFLRQTDAKGRVTAYVLAVDWARFRNEAVSVEVLAHEYGHMVTTELYARADPRSRRAIDQAYDKWLASTHGKSVDDILRETMGAAELSEFAGGASNRAYATNFWEWAARNAALYLMDPKRAHAGKVATFFHRVAEALRQLYATVTGHKDPDATWSEALDRWVAGTMEVGSMPTLETNQNLSMDHAPATPADNRQMGTLPLKPLQKLFTAANNNETGSKVIHGLKSNLLSLTTMRQIERQFRDTPVGPHLSGWVRNQQLKAKTANIAREAGGVALERAHRLDAKVRAVLEEVMYKATHFGVHPELAITDPKNAHLLRGAPGVVETNEKRYLEARDRYNAMVKADPRAAGVYAGLRDAFTDLHAKTLERLLENVQQSKFSEGAKTQIVQRIKNAQREMKEGPYFPLMRFGDWRVTVQLPAFAVGQGGKENSMPFATRSAAREEMRNQRALNPGASVSVEQADGGYMVRVFQRGVYFFDSEAAARNATADIEAEVKENYLAANVNADDVKQALEDEDGNPGQLISPPKLNRDDYAAISKASPEFMQEVRSLVTEKKLDPEVAATLERLAIESLPENSYRKSLLPRQNIFGASKQMLRAYAHRYQGAAYHYATVEHGAALNKNWSEAWKVANEGHADAARALNTLNRGQELLAERMKPTWGNRLSNAVTSASSLMSLGFSPAFVIMNSTQPWTVTAPVLAGLQGRSGTIGMAKAMKYLGGAYKGGVPYFTKRGVQDFIDESKALLNRKGSDMTLQETAQEIVTKFGQTEGEKAMLQSLLDRGTLDFSWLSSLQDAMANSKGAQKWESLQRLSMAFPQQVEALNRVVSALAAYRLARDEGIVENDEGTLQEFADDMVADTQLDYSRLNRPNVFNSKWGTILQFKLYVQGMYALFARNAMMAMHGASPEEKRQGRATLAYMLMSHAAAAGAAGLGPGTFLAKMALLLAAKMSDDDDDDWKTGDQLLHEFMVHHFGEDAGAVAEHGLPALAGMDLSDRLGFPNLVDTKYMDLRDTDTASQGLDKWVLYSLGAPYANFKRLISGGDAALKGDWQRAVNGLPSAVRGVLGAGLWASHGILDTDGDTFIPQSELGWGTLAIKSLGLNPLQTSRAYSDRRESKNIASDMLKQRSDLMKAYRTADDRGDVVNQIREFNARVPAPFRVKPKDMRDSIKQKRQRESGRLNKQDAAIKKMLG